MSSSSTSSSSSVVIIKNDIIIIKNEYNLYLLLFITGTSQPWSIDEKIKVKIDINKIDI